MQHAIEAECVTRQPGGGVATGRKCQQVADQPPQPSTQAEAAGPGRVARQRVDQAEADPGAEQAQSELDRHRHGDAGEDSRPGNPLDRRALQLARHGVGEGATSALRIGYRCHQLFLDGPEGRRDLSSVLHRKRPALRIGRGE